MLLPTYDAFLHLLWNWLLLFHLKRALWLLKQWKFKDSILLNPLNKEFLTLIAYEIWLGQIFRLPFLKYLQTKLLKCLLVKVVFSFLVASVFELVLPRLLLFASLTLDELPITLLGESNTAHIRFHNSYLILWTLPLFFPAKLESPLAKERRPITTIFS